MKKYVFVFIAFLLSVSLFAQEKKNLSMEDAIYNVYFKFQPESISQLSWRGDLPLISWMEDDKVFQSEVKKDTKEFLFSLEELNAALQEVGFNALKRMPYYSWVSSDLIAFHYKGNYFIYDIKQKTFVFKSLYGEKAENISVCKQNNSIAFTIGNNLFIVGQDGKAMNLTNDENQNHVYGQSVSRNEFGISGGIFWSPVGKKIGFYKKDESRVSDYPLVDYMQRVAEKNEIKYPMAGMPSEYVYFGIYDLESKKTIYLETQAESEEYLTNVSWSPDGQHVYIAVVNRAQNHMKFNKYDAQSGKLVKTLFEEKNERYVEPMNPMHFLSSDPELFVWESRRDGFNHLYLYTVEGELKRQLTQGEWLVTSYLGTDNKDKYAYFVATKESPLERHLYRTSLSNGKIEKLSHEEGVHKVSLSADKKYIIDQYSSQFVPRVIELNSTKGKQVREVLRAANPYEEIALGETKIGTLKANDGKTDLYYRMTLPTNFDPTKKYPVIVYVYGGPHAQLVMNSFNAGAQMWQHYMAQRGYIAFTLDNRGSANRGFEFESTIHRNLGEKEVDDQMTGVDYLKSLPYVDAERIGVHGWSYGGFMTTSLMLKKPEVFKVGVAGGPVIDWKYYEIMYGERYMDTPDENPDGYQKANLTNYVKNLKGRLLIIHGAQDPTVVMQHSLVFTRECVKQGVLFDYFVYPTHPHNVRGYDRIHLMNKVSQYFEDFL